MIYSCTWHLVERLVVFEPEESGQRSALHVALHRERLGHIHCLVGEAALIAWCLQGCDGREKGEQKPETDQQWRRWNQNYFTISTLYQLKEGKMHSCGFENQGKRKKIPLKRTYVLQALTQAYTANSTSEAGISLCFSALLHLSSVFMSLHIDAVQASSIFSIMCGCGYRAAWDLLSVGIFKPLASQRQFRCDPCVLPLPRVEFFSIISGAA